TPALTLLACVSRSVPTVRGGGSTVSSYATASRRVSYNRAYRVKCLIKSGWCAVADRRPAALGDVVAPATPATQPTCGLPSQVPRRQAPPPRPPIDRDHHGRRARGGP